MNKNLSGNYDGHKVTDLRTNYAASSVIVETHHKGVGQCLVGAVLLESRIRSLSGKPGTTQIKDLK